MDSVDPICSLKEGIPLPPAPSHYSVQGRVTSSEDAASTKTLIEVRIHTDHHSETEFLERTRPHQ